MRGLSKYFDEDMEALLYWRVRFDVLARYVGRTECFT